MIEFEKLLELESKCYPDCEFGPISQYIKEFPLPDDVRNRLNEYKITNNEYLAILLLRGNQQALFQDYHIENRPPTELELTLSNLLDSALRKLPPTECECLGRYDCYSDLSNYEENQIITVDYFLTATERNLGDVAGTKVIWIITPLSKDETRARRIYPINEIKAIPEYQVNFMRGTKFKIEKIEPVESKPYSRMYATEIK